MDFKPIFPIVVVTKGLPLATKILRNAGRMDEVSVNVLLHRTYSKDITQPYSHKKNPAYIVFHLNMRKFSETEVNTIHNLIKLGILK
jgi:hypothetical protein